MGFPHPVPPAAACRHRRVEGKPPRAAERDWSRSEGLLPPPGVPGFITLKLVPLQTLQTGPRGILGGDGGLSTCPARIPEKNEKGRGERWVPRAIGAGMERAQGDPIEAGIRPFQRTSGM